MTVLRFWRLVADFGYWRLITNFLNKAIMVLDISFLFFIVDIRAQFLSTASYIIRSKATMLL